MVLAVLAMAGCAAEGGGADSATAAGSVAAADPTQRTAGGGVPDGYVGRTDRGEPISEVSYSREAENWRVATGPAHILYQSGDTASGAFTVRTQLHVMNSRPDHPEGFGLFVGGRELDADSQQYSYFLVRGTGEYFLSRRTGATTSAVRGWTAHPAIPKADSTGRAPNYNLAVRVAADSVRFMVNDQQVAAVAKSQFPADGTYGTRVNHNLQMHVWPVTITRP
jgi:hypothetical protein